MISVDTLTLDSIQFIKEFRLFIKTTVKKILVSISIPCILLNLKIFFNLGSGIINLISGAINSIGQIGTTLLTKIYTTFSILHENDGPNFLYIIIPFMIIEYYLEKYILYPDIEINEEFDSRQILVRDRLFSLGAYWLFSQQFYTIINVNLKMLELKDAKFLESVRTYVLEHYLVFSHISQTYPLSAALISIIIYKYILRRRNGYDTVWFDYTKRMEWHGRLIPPLKHMVRYHWCLAWLFSIYVSCLVECFDILCYFSTPGPEILVQWKWFILFLYYVGSYVFICGPIFAMLGLRPYFPPLHDAIINQVGVWSPPGYKQGRGFSGELDEKLRKFRF